LAVAGVAAAATPEERELLAELKNCPYRIAHESYRDNHWVLAAVDADGSNPTIISRTPGANEMYPHVSPDGKKICFVCDEGEGKAKRRNVYMMNMDGSGRRRVVEAARDPAWTADAGTIVYLKDEVDEFQRQDYATKGVCFYDLATGKHRQLANKDLYHLYNICPTPDGKWLVASVACGVVAHAIIAFDADGQNYYDLHVTGCRPDISADGKMIAWGADDYNLRVGEFDCSGPQPKIVRQRNVVTSEQPMMVYHVDWSPDGKYLAFSRGAPYGRLGDQTAVVGSKAKGWNICVADAAKTNCWTTITHDGKSNKEPDWYLPAAK
jgi:Tol biopolymer transport system component